MIAKISLISLVFVSFAAPVWAQTAPASAVAPVAAASAAVPVAPASVAPIAAEPAKPALPNCDTMPPKDLRCCLETFAAVQTHAHYIPVINNGTDPVPACPQGYRESPNNCNGHALWCAPISSLSVEPTQPAQ